MANPHREADLSPQEVRKLRNMRRTDLHETRNHVADACPGTLEHFLSDEVFKTWQDSPESSALCVHGPPGQGKSVLAKFLVNHLAPFPKTPPRVSTTIISFFCREHQDRPADILRSLILQLVDCHELFEYIPSRYHKYQQEFFDASVPDLWDIFETLILNSSLRQVYCIIDAFDECAQNGSSRANLLQKLIKVTATEHSTLKLLVTSRPGERDLEPQFQGVSDIKLRVRTEDLNLFIKTRVTLLDNDSFSQQTKDHIQEKVAAEAQGTYLWASIVIEEISKLEAPSMDEVDKVLMESPKDLNELYRKLVTQLQKRNPIFAKILIWVAYSAR